MSHPTLTNCLFSNVSFFLTGKPDPDVLPILLSGGARRLRYLSGLATHCIAGKDPDYNELGEAEELLLVPVVTQDWVTASAKCGHLLSVRGFYTGTDQLFSSVNMILDWDSLSREDWGKLWAMVTFNGGSILSEGENGTHFVTGAMGEWVESYNTLIVLTPDWVVDSLKAGKMVNEVQYHPNLLIIEIPSLSEDVIDNASPKHESDEMKELNPLSKSFMDMTVTIESPVGVISPEQEKDEEMDSLCSIQLVVNEKLNLPDVNGKSDDEYIVKNGLEDSNSTRLNSTSVNIIDGDDGLPNQCTSDYFSQDTGSTEDHLSLSSNNKREYVEDLESSIDDIFKPSPVKKSNIVKFISTKEAAASGLLSPSPGSKWKKSDKFRTEYTRQEAEALIKFFMEQGTYFLKGGNQIWKVVEEAGICPGRSWQSLKNYFCKHLVQHLPNFNLTEEDLMEAARRRDKFKVPGLCKNIASDVKITTCFYTLNEDKKILNYILDHGFVEGMSVSGNRIWKLMEKRTVVVGRTWQSLKERFRKIISKNLERYNLSELQKEKIYVFTSKKPNAGDVL